MRRFLIPSCLLILLILPTPSKSGCYGGNYLGACYYQSYQPAPYVPPVYNYNYSTTYVYPAAIPLYSVGYQQPSAVISGAVSYSQQIVASQSSVQSTLSTIAQQSAATVTTEQSERLLRALETIAAASSGGQRMFGQQLSEPPHAAILRRDCGQCHSGANAKAKFAMFDAQGAFTGVREEDIGKVIFRLTTRNTDQSKGPVRMPPDRKMNPDDRDAVLEALVTQQPKLQQQEPGRAVQPGPIDPKKLEDNF